MTTINPIMNGKFLVTYATRGGTTKGVAEAIAGTLAAAGLEVDLLPVESVLSLSPYRAAVIGSAIQGQAWLPEAMQFVHAHQAELRQMPVAVFLVCMTLAIKNSQYRQAVSGWIEPVRRLVRPVSEGLFAGALNLRNIPSAGDRFKFWISVRMGVWAEGDHRDWNAIQAWASGLVPLVSGTKAQDQPRFFIHKGQQP